MIELVFVIVVIGILAGVALPRLAATRTDAVIVKGKSQIAAIRSGIALQKSQNLLRGERQSTSYYPDDLDLNTTAFNTSGERLFNFSDGNNSNILETAIFSEYPARSGYWYKTALHIYQFVIEPSNEATFTYTPANGSFNCTGSSDCNTLTR